MQKISEIDAEVARIGAERFLCCAFAEAGCFEVLEELLANVFGQTLELTADCGFVDAQEAREVEESAAIEKVG